MKTVYFYACLILGLLTTEPYARAAGPSAPGTDAATACESLLGMVRRVFLPHTRAGRTYPSGFVFGGPGETSRYIATFFAFLRTPEDLARLTEELEHADLRQRIGFMHRLSLAFAQTAFNLSELMAGDQRQYVGQDDDHVVRLLQYRQHFVREVVLPSILARGPDLFPEYFEELVAIAANFANVPTAYEIAGLVIDAVEPHHPAYRAAGGALAASELAKIKSHALALTYLESPEFTDREHVEQALDRTSDLLREGKPQIQIDWLIPQLAYWFQVGFSTQNAPPYPRAAFVARRLIDALPPDLSFAAAAYSRNAQDLTTLIRAEPWLPGFINEGRRDRLRHLVVRH
jgi:hypothetical protein